MLTQKKINDLREVYRRGGPEGDNAKRILERVGVDLTEPKMSFKDKVKTTFKMNIEKDYFYQLEESSDILLMSRLLHMIVGEDHKAICIKHALMCICVTEQQNAEIRQIFFKHRESFNTNMFRESRKYVEQYIYEEV